MLKIRTDSLEQAIKYKDTYLENIKTVLSGNTVLQRDTIPINVESKETSPD